MILQGANIIVWYLRWGCGAEKVKYEEQKEPIPEKIIWNICKEYQEFKNWR